MLRTHVCYYYICYFSRGRYEENSRTPAEYLNKHFPNVLQTTEEENNLLLTAVSF